MIRPLLTAILEYALMIYVLKKGKIYPKEFASVLFFLATYQLGEVIVFLTDGDRFGLRIAYFATTMLPPLGLLLVQKMTKRNYGYWIVQAIALIFGFLFVFFNSEMIESYELGEFCIRVLSYGSLASKLWQAYYLIAVILTMLILLFHFFRSKLKELKKLYGLMFIGYSSFFITSFIVALIFESHRNSIASCMCALAVIGAVIFTKISTTKIHNSNA
jgi:hypothetical protein